jgi:hypothetical protein
MTRALDFVMSPLPLLLWTCLSSEGGEEERRQLVARLLFPLSSAPRLRVHDA